MRVIEGYGLFLAVMSAVGFALMGIDKWKARSGRWRTPEKTLMTVGLLGGALGAWAGMAVFRHKTQHRMFAAGLPFLALLQIALGIWLFVKGGAR